MKYFEVFATVAPWFLFGMLSAVPAFAWHGAGTQALAIDPGMPTTVYVATEPATVFKSVNGGADWIVKSTAVDSSIVAPRLTLATSHHPALEVQTRADCSRNTISGANSYPQCMLSTCESAVGEPRLESKGGLG